MNAPAGRDHPAIVTISATYGAGSSVIGPDVARRLGVPYLERIVSHDLARAATSPPEGPAEEERGEGFWRRLFEALTTMPSIVGATMPQPDVGIASEEQVRDEVEATIRDTTRERGGVVVGRGATCFLSGEHRVLHVRLDGPRDRRIEQAMQIEGIGHDEAERRLTEVDKTRAAYVRRLYGCDITDAKLYHLLLDSTFVPLDECAELIARAARASLAGH
ncbi:MAG TPA: cytidylate kinase-like family protein [Acidimicrobiia bacterium]|jgi:cytidylate kinase